ncbi:PAS domain S-box-containing protein [Mucilaginibacter frigoritolerans]|uniref:histidine kinase n=1 Tax=Mucilaginibacter frigoritolerans TaxID=652788 RepID=A0A562TKY3_9SPHI|nr:PAS domain S-box protein [Mucilaginibacter frigoritolerans]TWI94187.1 PAS domain S-box-containing protein [Mucilaginibacter frigoritolerans]
MNYHPLLKEQIQAQLSPNLFRNGSLQNVFYSISNVYHTFEKRAQISEQAFRLSKKQHQEVLERLQLSTSIGGIGIWIWDAATCKFEWDETMYKLYGADYDNFSPNCWMDKVHPADRVRMKKESVRAFKGLNEFDTQFRIIYKDGSTRYIRAIGLVQPDHNGNPLKMIGTNWDVTETTLAAQNLEKVNKDLNAFFRVMDDVFFSIDAENGKVIQVSQSCEKLLGYSTEEFMADYSLYFQLVHPDEAHIVNSEWYQLKKGIAVCDQYRIVRKDGSVCWVENKIVPTIDDNGRLIRFDGIVRDISQQKSDETKLKLSEERYRQIVETAHEGIWTIDEHNRTTFVNKRIVDILGYPAEEIVGKNFLHFVVNKYHKRAINDIENMRRGIPTNLDIKHRTKNGCYIWVNVTANPIFDNNGHYTGALAMVMDITQRKKDEEAQKKSEANLKTLVNNTESAYVLIDTAFKTVSFNKIAEGFAYLRLLAKLAPGTHIKEYFTDERWPFIMETLVKVKLGEVVRYELNVDNPDGSVSWFIIRWIGVKNEHNKHCGFIFAAADITETKLNLLEKEQMLSDILQRNKDLEQFTYIISHNLRAPVANVIGLSNMINGNILKPNEIKEANRNLQISANNIDTVINDLNQIIQAREFVNERKETIIFNNLVEVFKSSISHVVAKECVRIECNFDGAASIFSIKSYFYSIFYNLLSNSIKYRQKSVCPVITIKSTIQNNMLELRFKDNGKGIDLNKNGTQLFGLYKRFDTTVEGKGMGLFMVKTQIEALGGSIKINSQPGEGTEFILQLPVK